MKYALPLIGIVWLLMGYNECNDWPEIPPPSPNTCQPPGSETTFSTSDVIGRWSDTKDWEIQWQFNSDGTFSKLDMIAPCPPDVQCFWSGIVSNAGRWNLSGFDILLSYDHPNNSHNIYNPAGLVTMKDCSGEAFLAEYEMGVISAQYYAIPNN